MSIFPIIQPVAAETASGALPLCEEVAWDYDKDIPVFSGGVPQIVTGKEAVKVWIWKAIRTARFKHQIYSRDYGSEFESLIGQAYTPMVKEAEAPRYLRECLLINPYINAVSEISVSFEGNLLTVAGTAETIYGKVDIYASV